MNLSYKICTHSSRTFFICLVLCLILTTLNQLVSFCSLIDSKSSPEEQQQQPQRKLLLRRSQLKAFSFFASPFHFAACFEPLPLPLHTPPASFLSLLWLRQHLFEFRSLVELNGIACATPPPRFLYSFYFLF